MNLSEKTNDRSPLQLGFIGGGVSSSIGRVHYVASQLDGRWQLVSGYFSRHFDISIKTAQTWYIKHDRIYDSLQTFINTESEKLDAVVILTPFHEHVKAIRSLLEKGIPVICEKPMASSLDEGYIIREYLDKYPSFFAVIYNYSGYPMVREIQEIVKSGELGKIKKLHFEMPQEGFLRTDSNSGELVAPRQWRLKDDYIPIICHDLGAHLHHLAIFITGKEPISVMGEFANHSSYDGVIDDVTVLLRYDNGMNGIFWMSKAALGTRNGLSLRIFGTKGSIEWKQMEPENLWLSYSDGTRINMDRASSTKLCGEPRYNRYAPGHPAGFVEAFANLYSDIADALILYRKTGKHNNPYVFGVNHAISGLKLFSAVSESNHSNCWIDLDR